MPYRVYTLLMTPLGKKAKEPGSGETTYANFPWVGDILNDADLK